MTILVDARWVPLKLEVQVVKRTTCSKHRVKFFSGSNLHEQREDTTHKQQAVHHLEHAANATCVWQVLYMFWYILQK